MLNNPGRIITDKEIGQLFRNAYLKAATVGTAIKGFEKCGIEPYNPNIFDDADFAPSSVSEKPFNETFKHILQGESSHDSQSDDEPLRNLQNNRNLTPPPSTSYEIGENLSNSENYFNVAYSQHLTPSPTSKKMGQYTPPPSTSREDLQSTRERKTLWKIKSLPHYQRKETNRKRTKTSIITSTPVKRILESKELDKTAQRQLGKKAKKATTTVPQLQKLLQDFANTSNEEPRLSTTHTTEHRIQLREEAPFRQRPYRYSKEKKRAMNQQVEQMLADGIVEPSTSNYSSPVVIVKKKNGQPRFCVDFRRLNQLTCDEATPLPDCLNVNRANQCAEVTQSRTIWNMFGSSS